MKKLYHKVILLFVNSFVYSFIHLFIYSCNICAFIYLFICLVICFVIAKRLIWAKSLLNHSGDQCFRMFY